MNNFKMRQHNKELLLSRAWAFFAQLFIEILIFFIKPFLTHYYYRNNVELESLHINLPVGHSYFHLKRSLLIISLI